MHKKHYEMIAAVFAGDYVLAPTDNERRVVVGLALSISQVLADDNPRFDRMRFLKACGLTKADAPISLAAWPDEPSPSTDQFFDEMRAAREPTVGCKRYGHHRNPTTGRCNRCGVEVMS